MVALSSAGSARANSTGSTAERFDYLAVCNGTFCEPHLPGFRGLDAFQAAGGPQPRTHVVDLSCVEARIDRLQSLHQRRMSREHPRHARREQHHRRQPRLRGGEGRRPDHRQFYWSAGAARCDRQQGRKIRRQKIRLAGRSHPRLRRMRADESERHKQRRRVAESAAAGKDRWYGSRLHHRRCAETRRSSHRPAASDDRRL